MGKKEKTLESTLVSTGLVTERTVRYLNCKLVAESRFAGEVDRVYRRLGGRLPTFPVGFRGWDIEFDGIGVELDEQLHFNRYRAVTLQSKIYAELPQFPLSAYQHYCEAYEDACLKAGKHGGRWTNKSCEKQFGEPGQHGELTGAGAPRWKQRAFYDFVKDLTPLILGVSVSRIAIWDRYGADGRLVNDVLMTDTGLIPSELVAFVRAKCF